jgi:hypothetical protein
MDEYLMWSWRAHWSRHVCKNIRMENYKRERQHCMLYILFLNNINNKADAKYWWNWLSVSMFMGTQNGYLVKLPHKWRITGCNGRVPCVVLAGTMIEVHVRNNGTNASSSSVPTHQQALVRAPSLNIYRRWFEFRPQIYTFPFLFLLHPQITETSATGDDEERCGLLTTDVNYTHLDECINQDDVLLMNPLHRHLFSRLPITDMMKQCKCLASWWSSTTICQWKLRRPWYTWTSSSHRP